MLLVTYLLLLFHTQPVAIVIPHHNLVASTRRQFLKNISRRRLITRHIVLISPDHFSLNQRQITTSDTDWNLSTGILKFNNFLNLNLPVDNPRLHNDHGIYNPLADLRTYFPDADVYPILIGQNVSAAILESRIQNLVSQCRFDCLLVASVDFSHYLPAGLAQVHDAFTLNQLQFLDTEKILKSEVDSPQSLYFLTSFAKLKNAQNWQLFAHTNSGFIAHDPDVETTTHIFGSYSRSFSRIQNLESSFSSVTIPYPLDRKSSQIALGDRFFYGADEFKVDPSVPFITASFGNTKYIYPVKDNLFLRGPEKQKMIKDYFDGINDSKITKDYFWSKLTY